MTEQRSRLISAAAVVFVMGSAPTVAAVAKAARVSRNTFYEYFDDLEHVRAAGELRAQRRLQAALGVAERRARTPVERWREIIRAWLDWVLEFPAESQLILTVKTGGMSAAGHELEIAFSRALAIARASGLGGASQDATATRVMAAAAAAEVLARSLIAERMSTTDEVPTARERQILERSLVDIAVRLLR